MKKKIIRISSIIGLVIFAYIIYKIGPVQIWENIKKITVRNFLILVLLRFFYWTLRTFNWNLVLDGYDIKNSFFHLLAARLSCHAVNHVMPSVNIGGEAARIMIVNSPSKKLSVASVIVDKTIESLSVIFFTIIGVAIVITRIPLPGKMKILLISFVGLIAILILYIMNKQKKGFFDWIINLLRKIKIKLKFLEKHMEKIEETDQYISEFYQKYRKLFLKVFLFYCLMFLFWAVEIHFTLLFIGAKSITFFDSFLVVSLGTLAFLIPISPAGIGVYEATYVGIFALLKLGPDVGITLILIRRLIALIWTGIGLLGMAKIKPERQKHY